MIKTKAMTFIESKNMMSTNNLLVCRVFSFICIVDNCFLLCSWSAFKQMCVQIGSLNWMHLLIIRSQQMQQPPFTRKKSRFFLFRFHPQQRDFILFAKQIKCLLISPTQTYKTNAILNINYTNKSIHFINFAIVLLLKGFKLARRCSFSIFSYAYVTQSVDVAIRFASIWIKQFH